MKIPFTLRARVAALVVSTFMGAAPSVHAFPPAPHHTLFGMVRNQWGDPLNVLGAEVFLQSSNGAAVRVEVAASHIPRVNYSLSVPMDAGTTLDLYQATAFRLGQSFRLQVQIGATTYLPLEMALSAPTLGQPASSTRLDLTLGEDSDGDGLPDAWELAIIAVLGGTLESITPDGDEDGDGVTNLNEYLAGTFAFDPSDGFSVAIAGVSGGNARLEFLTIRGRTYEIETATQLGTWSRISFRVLNGGVPGSPQSSYLSTDVRLLQVDVPAPSGGETNRFFRALVR